MKDMGRSGHVAFCAILLFYCSFITASSPHLSVKRKDGVSEVNMTSVLQTTEMDFSNQTQPSVNSSEPTAHTDTTAGMNSTNPLEDVSFSENITDSRNMSDASHVQNQTASTTLTPTTHLPSATHKSTTSLHTTTITASSRTTHSSSPESGPDPSPTAVQNTQKSQSSSSSTSSSPAQARAHMDTPSALNVGDDDSNKVSTDPLLAGLVAAFVVVAAIVSVLVFLKFRNTNNGPEFRRLQDLPMDDMLEDAPLSMYSY